MYDISNFTILSFNEKTCNYESFMIQKCFYDTLKNEF